MKTIIVILALFALSFIPDTAFSERATRSDTTSSGPETCLQSAERKIHLNRKLTVVQNDGIQTREVTGLLEAIHPDQGSMLVRLLNEEGKESDVTETIREDQIQTIHYRATGSVQSSWTGYGFLAGATLGLMAGLAAGGEDTQGDIAVEPRMETATPHGSREHPAAVGRAGGYQDCPNRYPISKPRTIGITSRNSSSNQNRIDTAGRSLQFPTSPRKTNWFCRSSVVLTPL